MRVEAAEKFGDDEDFFLHLIAELGCDSGLEKQLLIRGRQLSCVLLYHYMQAENLCIDASFEQM